MLSLMSARVSSKTLCKVKELMRFILEICFCFSRRQKIFVYLMDRRIDKSAVGRSVHCLSHQAPSSLLESAVVVNVVQANTFAGSPNPRVKVAHKTNTCSFSAMDSSDRIVQKPSAS